MQVRLLLDQDECTIEVSDSFGSLRWADLCDSLERCLKSVTPRSDLEGGAGLGLNMILHTANSLSVLVSPNEATVAIASLGRESATCCSRSGTLHFHTGAGNQASKTGHHRPTALGWPLTVPEDGFGGIFTANTGTILKP